jgi:hypothetical protein
MPFIVVVHADDAASARAIRDRYLDGDQGTTIGVFVFPHDDERLCAGADCEYAGRQSGWGRHARGYTVHACGKRNPRWWGHLPGMFYDTFGRNLLKRHTVISSPGTDR